MSKTSNTIGANMLLVSSYWGENKSFKIIPLSNDCPYTEGMYDPTTNILVVIGKDKKNSLHMVVKLDDNGDPMEMKGKPRKNGKNYKEERKTVETYQEYYILEKDEQENFIRMFCINHDAFDYKKFMVEKTDIITPPEPKIEVVSEMPK
jgi:hypothetical protein